MLATALQTTIEYLTGESDRQITTIQSIPNRPDPKLTELERALFRAMDPDLFDPQDFDAVRTALRQTKHLHAEIDAVTLARDFLVAAKELREKRVSADPAAIGVLAAVHSAQRLAREVKEVRQEVADEIGSTSGIRPAYDDDGQPVEQRKAK